jgi:hypothetical protein
MDDQQQRRKKVVFEQSIFFQHENTVQYRIRPSEAESWDGALPDSH